MWPPLAGRRTIATAAGMPTMASTGSGHHHGTGCKRIDVLAVAIRAGLTVFDLEHLELAYAPTYGAAKDPVNMAGFVGANLLRGDIDLWYAEDYPDCRDQVTILDVRTPTEYGAWHIPRGGPHPHRRERRHDQTDHRAGQPARVPGRRPARSH
jgi:hypothetical protein